MSIRRGSRWNNQHPIQGALLFIGIGLFFLIPAIRDGIPQVAIIGGLIAAFGVFKLVKALKD